MGLANWMSLSPNSLDGQACRGDGFLVAQPAAEGAELSPACCWGSGASSPPGLCASACPSSTGLRRGRGEAGLLPQARRKSYWS